MKNEEAHVSRKKLKHGEKVELLVKVELVSSTFSSISSFSITWTRFNSVFINKQIIHVTIIIIIIIFLATSSSHCTARN